MPRSKKSPADGIAKEVVAVEVLPKVEPVAEAKPAEGQTRSRKAKRTASTPGSTSETTGKSPAPRPRSRRSTAAPVVAPPAPGPEAEGAGEEAARHLAALRGEREQVQQELQELRQQARTAQDAYLREALAGAERVKSEFAATEDLMKQIRRTFQEAAQDLLNEFEGQLGLVRKELAGSHQLLQTLLPQAESFHQRLAQMWNRLPEAERQLQGVEQASEATRQDLRALDEEALVARQRLDALHHETTSSEARLAAVRLECDEAAGRLRELRRQLKEVTQGVSQTQEQVEEIRQEVPEESGPAPEGRNRLGMTVDPGVVVAELLPDTPAAAAGLAPGDVIRGVNGLPVLSGEQLRDQIQAIADGEELTIQLTRSGAPVELKARLEAAADEPAERKPFGVTVAPGVVVAEVLPDTPADVADLERGDVVLEVNGTPVVTGEQLRQMIQPLLEGAEVHLRLRRGEQTHEIHVRLDEPALVP
jgi:hypothetical protein